MVIVMKQRITRIVLSAVFAFVDILIICDSAILIYRYVEGESLFLYMVPYYKLIMRILCGLTGLLLSLLLVKSQIKIRHYMLATLLRYFVYMLMYL